MTIIESNGLIAEFMRLELEETLHGLKVYAVKINRNNPLKLNDIETEFFLVEELKYHLSWDWIMPVVIECFNRYDVVEDVRDNQQFLLNDALLETNITSLYKAVVNFIQWYNKNNK